MRIDNIQRSRDNRRTAPRSSLNQQEKRLQSVFPQKIREKEMHAMWGTRNFFENIMQSILNSAVADINFSPSKHGERKSVEGFNQSVLLFPYKTKVGASIVPFEGP